MDSETTEGSVKFIRMNTGEDLISQVVEIKENDNVSYIFVSPLKILYTLGSTPGHLQISMMEWVFSKICDVQEFAIYPTDVITMTEPAESMISYYWDTVEHFQKMKEKQNERINFSETNDMIGDDSVYEDPQEEYDSVKQLLDQLKNGTGKRKLH